MAVQQVNLKWKCTKTSTSDPFPSQLTYDLHSCDRVRALSIRLNTDHSAVCAICVPNVKSNIEAVARNAREFSVEEQKRC